MFRCRTVAPPEAFGGYPVGVRRYSSTAMAVVAVATIAPKNRQSREVVRSVTRRSVSAMRSIRFFSPASEAILNCATMALASSRYGPALLEQLEQGDDQAALCDQSADQPLQKVSLGRFDIGLESGFAPGDVGFGFLPQGLDLSPDGLDIGFGGQPQGLNLGLDGFDIGFGGEVGVEQCNLLFGENLGLFLGEAVLGQSLDVAMGIERDGFGHDGTIGPARAAGKDGQAASQGRYRTAAMPAATSAVRAATKAANSFQTSRAVRFARRYSMASRRRLKASMCRRSRSANRSTMRPSASSKCFAAPAMASRSSFRSFREVESREYPAGFGRVRGLRRRAATLASSGVIPASSSAFAMRKVSGDATGGACPVSGFRVNAAPGRVFSIGGCGETAGRSLPPARRSRHSPAAGRRAWFRRVLALLFLSLLTVPAASDPAAARDTGTPTPATGALAVAGQSSLPDVMASRVSSGAGDVHQPTPAAADSAAVPSAAGQPGRHADETDLAAAAQPGRQSPPPAAAPATGSPAGAYELAILQAFECPIGPIAVMLEAAQGQSEFSPALEVEREVLALCRDRWAVLKELVDAELSLASVLRASAAARAEEEVKLAAVREREALALEEQRRLAQARIEGARQGALEAARAARAREEAAAAAAAAAKAEPETVSAPETPAPVREPPRDYGWFAVMGSGADLRAAVTDGRNVWRVEAGDRLPGGVVVRAVEARPPGVRVTGWRTDRLPYRSRASR